MKHALSSAIVLTRGSTKIRIPNYLQECLYQKLTFRFELIKNSYR